MTPAGRTSPTVWLAVRVATAGVLGLAILIARDVFASQGILPHDQSVTVWVPTHNLSGYHRIRAGDVTPRSINGRDAPAGVVTQATPIVGRYVLAATSARTPIAATQVSPDVNKTLPPNPVVLGIPATSAMVLGGQLRPGARVQVICGQQSAGPQKAGTASPALTDATVLSVDRRADSAPAGEPYVLVLAVNASDQRHCVAGNEKTGLLVTGTP